MTKDYLLKSSEKTAKLARLFAKSVDVFIALILSIFFYPVGILLAVLYICIADSLQGGQSVGKKLMGLCVVSIEDGSLCTLKKSAVRNLPISIPLLFAIIPFWGWILAIIAAGLFLPLELYLMVKIDSGNRLGDVMADTTVTSNIDMPEKKQSSDPWLVKGQQTSR
mgnify:CR=1 FL=1